MVAEIDRNPWRGDFSVLGQTMHGKRLAFLDSGASAQKPDVVLDAVRSALSDGYANIHRGLYEFSQSKTAAFESVRQKVANFIGVRDAQSIVFTRNSTEAINLVAQSWGRTFLKEGDEIILTEMEHHANFVPWHILKNQIGIVIKYIPVMDNGALDVAALPSLLTERTRLVAFTHVSNVLGTVNPVAEISKTIRAFSGEIKILVDGTQSVVHAPVDISAFDPDFFVFTGHKLYGPTGVGVLYGRKELLDAMPPWQGGGDMIERVSLEGVTFAPVPAKFEAGTPAIAEVIGLGAAIDYLQRIGMDKIAAWEQKVLRYATEQISSIEGVRIYGTSAGKAGILSFNIDGCPDADIAMILDRCGVAVRTGHHCCQPLMQRFGIEGTVRASIGLYTDKDDIDQLVAGLNKAREMLL